MADCLLNPVISANGLEKSFGAVRGVDIKVQQGSAFCLLGPNGAGKSSIINMIARPI